MQNISGHRCSFISKNRNYSGFSRGANFHCIHPSGLHGILYVIEYEERYSSISTCQRAVLAIRDGEMGDEGHPAVSLKLFSRYLDF